MPSGCSDVIFIKEGGRLDKIDCGVGRMRMRLSIAAGIDNISFAPNQAVETIRNPFDPVSVSERSQSGLRRAEQSKKDGLTRTRQSDFDMAADHEIA